MKDIGYELKKGIRYLKHYGLREFVFRLREKGEPENLSYADFLLQNQITEDERKRQVAESAKWKEAPQFFCLVPEVYAEAAEEQMRKQTYPNCEVCAGADWSHLPEVTDFRDREDTASGVSEDEMSDGCGLSAGRTAQGRVWYFFLAEGDILDPSALYFAARAILFPEKERQSGLHWEPVKTPDLIYTDEDEVTRQGEYLNPQMKPDFSPDLLEETCYIRHLLLVSLELAKKARNGLSGMAAGRSVHDRFAYACAQRAESVFHIPRVLYHRLVWSETEETSDARGYQILRSGNYSACKSHPLVSIIIPNRDEKETLEKCLRAIDRSSYDRYEVIVVENNSTAPEIFDFYESLKKQPDTVVVIWDSEAGFNYSAINNFGVSHAKGEYLVFLNNDVEILTADWLERLLADCARPEVGAAGVKLLYPDGTVQHAGIVVGIGGHARGVASNMMVGLPDEEGGYMNRASLRQNFSAVTAACMMMKRSVFEEIGGFTEDLTVAFNDVDLCLKARKAGYLIVYDPYVKGYHYESKSRGLEDSQEKVRRFQSEIEFMRTRWEDILKGGDPYYSPNLTEYRPDYSLRAGRTGTDRRR